MSATRDSNRVPERIDPERIDPRIDQRIDRRIGLVAERQHGVFSRGQALQVGATKGMIRRRLRDARWERVHRGVYRLVGAASTWRGRLLAACIAWGPGTVVSHHAAAALRLFPGFEPGAVEITVPRGRRGTDGVVIVHSTRHLPPAEVTVIDGIPVTTPARTLLDLAAVCAPALVEEALDDALRRRLVSVSRMRDQLAAASRRRGVAVMDALVAARGASPVPESVLETSLLRLIRDDRLPEPVRQFQIRDPSGRPVARVDFAYPDHKLAIEADGYRWHSSRVRWHRDLRRRNAIAALGWRSLHLTSHEIIEHPRRGAAAIRAALRGDQANGGVDGANAGGDPGRLT